MSKYIYWGSIVLAFTFLGLTSCKDENDFSDHVEFDTMLARPDSFYYSCLKYVPSLGKGISIIGNARYHRYNDNFSLVLTNYSDTSYWESDIWWSYLNEQMGMYSCELELGKIIVGDKSVIFEDCKKGIGTMGKYSHDIPLASYDIDTSKVSWVEVTAIDSVKKVVYGKFELHFVLYYEHDPSAEAFARKLSYVDGEFRAKGDF